ncbi:hypothetical protein [Novosphingobium capsulatum]|uniref:hypothetical protein n=1 Tax=Novosphingobium capsulatum TaxID=13688 RepID=UPI002E155514
MEKLLSQKNLAPRWYERFPRALPVGIFTLTMAVTALSVFAIERADRQREIAQLDKVAQEVSSGLERRANGNAAYLRSAAALFATRRSVEASLFRSFVGQLQMEGSASGVNGIGWGYARGERRRAHGRARDAQRRRPCRRCAHAANAAVCGAASRFCQAWLCRARHVPGARNRAQPPVDRL